MVYFVCLFLATIGVAAQILLQVEEGPEAVSLPLPLVEEAWVAELQGWIAHMGMAKPPKKSLRCMLQFTPLLNLLTLNFSVRHYIFV